MQVFRRTKFAYSLLKKKKKKKKTDGIQYPFSVVCAFLCMLQVFKSLFVKYTFSLITSGF